MSDQVQLPTVKRITGVVEEVTDRLSKTGVNYRTVVINTERQGCIITTHFESTEFTPCEGDMIKGYVEVQGRYLTLRSATLLERPPVAPLHTQTAEPSLPSTSVNLKKFKKHFLIWFVITIERAKLISWECLFNYTMVNTKTEIIATLTKILRGRRDRQGQEGKAVLARGPPRKRRPLPQRRLS